MGLNRLTKVFKTAKEIEFDAHSRIVLMSDCHRGDGSWADTFAKNQNIYFYALRYYEREKYTYIEIGDGDELWENLHPNDIISAHKDVFWMLSKFHQQGRLFWIFGNHDMAKKDLGYVQKYYERFYDERRQVYSDLFRGLQVHEGLILRYADTGKKIFLVHGHQVDFINSNAWRLAKFLVRNVWRPLELFGVNDPTSTAKNYKKKKKVEEKLEQWVDKNKQMMIAGHTHRPVFADLEKAPYFNDGSCVHPRCITAIEIINGEIALVKWSVLTKNDGTLRIGRQVLVGPRSINAYI